jgi:flagellar hook-length control protein FliK
MMNMDIAAFAAAAADAACASAETPADMPADACGAFTTLLDEAACEWCEATAESKDREGCFDELAALAMTSLLCLGEAAPPPPADDTPVSDACMAQDITDNAVVTDLHGHATIVENEWSSTLTIAGDDMSAGETLDPVDADAIGRAESIGRADAIGRAVTIGTPPPVPTSGAVSEKAAGDAVDAWLTAADTPANAPVAKIVASMEDSGARETKASAGKVDADVNPTAKTARTKTPRSSEPASELPARRELDVRAVQSDSSTAAGHEAEDVSIADREPRAPVERAAGSSAVRFARALERAAAWTAPESGADASGANAGREGGQHSRDFGEGASSRATQFSAAIRQSAANTAAFAVHAPAPIEIRPHAAAAAAVAGHALDTAPMTIPERDVIAQLVQSMRVQFRDGVGEAVLKLKPEHLGSVQISLRVENGAIKATVQAEAPAVRQWLESHQDTLRTSLAEHGLRLDRFVVEPEGEPKRSTDDPRHPREQEQQRRRQQRRHQPENDTPVFEVTV